NFLIINVEILVIYKTVCHNEDFYLLNRMCIKVHQILYKMVGGRKFLDNYKYHPTAVRNILINMFSEKILELSK
ncbi:hypothetical protein BpHYR1_016846, partial [Brachionus plicatilis]